MPEFAAVISSHRESGDEFLLDRNRSARKSAIECMAWIKRLKDVLRTYHDLKRSKPRKPNFLPKLGQSIKELYNIYDYPARCGCTFMKQVSAPTVQQSPGNTNVVSTKQDFYNRLCFVSAEDNHHSIRKTSNEPV